MPRIRAMGAIPTSLARCPDITIIADAPSDNADELPAVTVPFTGSNTGFNSARASCLACMVSDVALSPSQQASFLLPMARPVLLTHEQGIGPAIVRLGLDPDLENHVEVVVPRRHEAFETLCQEYSKMRARKGVTLKVAENIWNYLPKINRVTKVPASMMAGSWMGSHFTNDDLVKESTFEDDYDSRLSFEGERDGQTIYEVTSLPKPDAAVVWGKVVMRIAQQTLAPFQALYYDEEGVLIRTLTFDQIQQIDGRAVPMRMALQPEDKPNESTVIVYHDIEFGVPLDTDFFSLQSLKQRR